MSDEWVDLARVAGLYDASIRQHGASPLGVGWRTEESQRHRFTKLLSVVDDDPFTVNDVGCGYGALFEHIRDASKPIRHFYGYDISEEMLAEGRRRLPPDQVDLIASDRPTVKADYSFASGIFNVRFDVSDSTWSEYARSAIRALAEQSSRGFGFNMLTAYVDYREPHLYYGDPMEWFDWCRCELTPRVALLHDYPLFEWTITARLR